MSRPSRSALSILNAPSLDAVDGGVYGLRQENMGQDMGSGHNHENRRRLAMQTHPVVRSNLFGLPSFSAELHSISSRLLAVADVFRSPLRYVYLKRSL